MSPVGDRPSGVSRFLVPQTPRMARKADGQQGATLSRLGCKSVVRLGGSADEMHIREQRFLVSTEPFYSGFWSSFVALFTSHAPGGARNFGGISRGDRYSPYLFRGADSRPARLPGKSFFGSVLMHAAAIFLLVRVVPSLSPALHAAAQPPIDKSEIYYFPKPQHHETLPRITPPGPGGSPGHGVKPQEKPLLGSSTFHRDLTVISNPMHPDNAHQTIIQPNSPPNLIIKQDLKLPNLVLGNPMAKPKAPLQFATDPLKPNAAQARTQDVAAPQLAMVDPGQIAALAATVQQPKLPIVPLAAPRALPGSSSSASAPGSAPAVNGGNPGEANGLLILGIDPAEPGSSIALPPGNRYGAFTMSSAGGGPGSPGGEAGGVAGGGSGSPGSSGDESTGLGSGRTGGGGGGSLSAGAPVSVSGSGAVGGTHGNLEAAIAADSVFPVITSPKLRRNALVISAGSAGGGGLAIYQALPCGRIYTIFVPMTTGSWTLQYCQQDASAASSRSSGTAAVIPTQGELLPPDPVEKYDFHRLPVPAGNAHNMLVIRGVVHDDGTVDTLDVYQSVMPDNDSRAVAALKKWKFTAARRDGKPVTIQILVGIQFTAPAAH